MNSSKTKNGSNLKIYVVKDTKGNVRFKGTAQEIEEKFGIKVQSVQAYYNFNYLFNGKYRVSQEKTESETYDYLLRHIREYGNTCLSEVSERKVAKFLKKLKEEDGIEATARRVKYKEDSGAWYVIERKKKDV